MPGQFSLSLSSQHLRLLIFSVLLAMYFGYSGAFAQQVTSQNNDQNTPAANEEPQFSASSWSVNCTPQSNSEIFACTLSKSIVMAKSGDTFVAVTIQPTPPGLLAEPYLMAVRLPHGLAFPAGVQFQIDDQKPGILALFTSSPQGAFARIGIINKMQSSLQKGKKLTISFTARNGRKFIVPISLQGFAAGFGKLK